MFLHGGFMHLLLNMLYLFFFGPRLEVRLSSRHFLGLYFTAGVVGALLHMASGFVLGTGAAPMVGASGGVFGVLLGYAVFWPKDQIYVWGIIPVEVRLLMTILILFAVVSGLGGAGGNIAHFAHLGGVVGAWLYLRLRDQTSAARQFQKKVESPAAKMGDRQLMDQWKRIDPEALHEVNRDTYERISEKIGAEGPASLTPRERTFVERFSRGAATSASG
jgi:membrane associated rhomboid family serine protease